MQIFALMQSSEGGWDLVGTYDMDQVPHVGEKILTRADDGLQALRVIDVLHFLTGKSQDHGAFVHVEDAEAYSVPAEMAEFFAR